MKVATIIIALIVSAAVATSASAFNYSGLWRGENGKTGLTGELCLVKEGKKYKLIRVGVFRRHKEDEKALEAIYLDAADGGRIEKGANRLEIYENENKIFAILPRGRVIRLAPYLNVEEVPPAGGAAPLIRTGDGKDAVEALVDEIGDIKWRRVKIKCE